jgi:hypothetical protein
MAFEDFGRHPQWPKVADAVIEAHNSINCVRSGWRPKLQVQGDFCGIASEAMDASEVNIGVP